MNCTIIMIETFLHSTESVKYISYRFLSFKHCNQEHMPLTSPCLTKSYTQPKSSTSTYCTDSAQPYSPFFILTTFYRSVIIRVLTNQNIPGTACQPGNLFLSNATRVVRIRYKPLGHKTQKYWKQLHKVLQAIDSQCFLCFCLN